MNPYVFVVGCPRSGTTLLQRLLDAHPRLAVINETLWITREADRPVTPELVSRLFEDRRFRRLGLTREQVELLADSGRRVPYRQFVSGVFDQYGEMQGKSLVGDKSPGYVRKVSKLHGLFPEARFVHLIRDGRDVWLSVAAWKKGDQTMRRFATWSEEPVVTAALWWERNVRLGRERGAALGPDLYRELRYEDLVADPPRECRALCSFLGLPYDDAMLRFHEGRTRHEPGLPAKRAWLPPTSGLRNWRTQMPSDDVELFEATAGELLEELGYPRRFPFVPEAARERAARVRSEFGDDLRARRRPLPGAWRS